MGPEGTQRHQGTPPGPEGPRSGGDQGGLCAASRPGPCTVTGRDRTNRQSRDGPGEHMDLSFRRTRPRAL